MSRLVSHSPWWMSSFTAHVHLHQPTLPSLFPSFKGPHHYYAGSDFQPRFHPPRAGSPCLLTRDFATIPSSTTPCSLHIALSRYPSAHAATLSGLGFAHSLAGSPPHTAESRSLPYGLVAPFPLLSTMPCGIAVTFRFGPESVCPVRYFPSLSLAPHRRTRADHHRVGRVPEMSQKDRP